MDDQQPVFVLVRPQLGENIGAAARAMLNFGLVRMRLTDPRDGWPNAAAVTVAAGAAATVLDRAGVFKTTAEAVGDCDLVFATTARGRDLTKPIFSPEAAMDAARKAISEGRKVAVLFGPERAGLENDDIARANAIISVPVNPDFPSLNLGQAVLLTAYEWRRHSAPVAAQRMAMAGSEMASQIELEKLGDHYEETLDSVGYFFPDTRVDSMKLSLRNLWTRMGLTRADVQTLHGMLRQLIRGRDGKP